LQAKALIIVEEKSQIEELVSLARKQKRQDGALTLIALDDAITYESEKDKLAFKKRGDYTLSNDFLQQESLKWFRLLADCRLRNNQNIKELLTYKGIALWWLVEQQIYMSKFAFTRMQDIIKQAIVLDRIIKSEQPSVIYYTDSHSPVSGIIKIICQAGNIVAVTVAHKSSVKQYLCCRFRVFAYINGLWLRIILRKIYCILAGQRNLPVVAPMKRKLLIFSSIAWSNVRDLKTGELRKGDAHLDSVIELLKDDSNIISIDTPTEDWGLSTMKEKRQQKKMAYKPFDSYLTAGTILEAFRAAIGLNKDYKRLSASEDFRQSFSYNELPLYNIIKQNLSLFFSTSHLVLIVSFIEMAERMLKTENPDVIIHYSDLPDSGRAVIAVAGARNIPVILLQHGLYERWHPYLNHIETDIGSDRQASAPYCPVPDKFAVSDGYTRDILIEQGRFGSEDVIVTGQPRYDVMADADRILNRERTLRNLKLNSGKKLVAWMTATHAFSLCQNERYINSIYSAVNSIDDIQLLVKLHPGENQQAPLYQRNATLKPIIVNRYGLTTFELLNAADVVIVNGHCSTAIEALLLDKPVIAMDYDDYPVLPYVQCGAAIGVFEADGILAALKDILSGEEILKKLAQARKEFIDRLGYKPDGKASQRVADLIRQMSKR